MTTRSAGVCDDRGFFVGWSRDATRSPLKNISRGHAPHPAVYLQFPDSVISHLTVAAVNSCPVYGLKRPTRYVQGPDGLSVGLGQIRPLIRLYPDAGPRHCETYI